MKAAEAMLKAWPALVSLCNKLIALEWAPPISECGDVLDSSDDRGTPQYVAPPRGTANADTVFTVDVAVGVNVVVSLSTSTLPVEVVPLWHTDPKALNAVQCGDRGRKFKNKHTCLLSPVHGINMSSWAVTAIMHDILTVSVHSYTSSYRNVRGLEAEFGVLQAYNLLVTRAQTTEQPVSHLMMRQVEQYGAKVMSMCIEKEPQVKTCFVGPFGGCTSERCYHSRLLCLLCVGPTWDRRVGACSLINAGAKLSTRMGTATSARSAPTAWSPADDTAANVMLASELEDVIGNVRLPFSRVYTLPD